MSTIILLFCIIMSITNRWCECNNYYHYNLSYAYACVCYAICYPLQKIKADCFIVYDWLMFLVIVALVDDYVHSLTCWLLLLFIMFLYLCCLNQCWQHDSPDTDSIKPAWLFNFVWLSNSCCCHHGHLYYFCATFFVALLCDLFYR